MIVLKIKQAASSNPDPLSPTLINIYNDYHIYKYPKERGCLKKILPFQLHILYKPRIKTCLPSYNV